jgi:hypothetical protein
MPGRKKGGQLMKIVVLSGKIICVCLKKNELVYRTSIKSLLTATVMGNKYSGIAVWLRK